MLSTYICEESEVQARIKQNAIQFGNKSANLIELARLCKECKSDGLQVQIPDIFPISDETIKAFLDKHAKNWRQLWSDFTKKQKEYTRDDNHFKKSVTFFGRTKNYGLPAKPKKEAAIALKSVLFDKADKSQLQIHEAALNNGELRSIYRKLKI